MKIDTEIRHVTPPEANIFLELGFSRAQAKAMSAALLREVEEKRGIKEQLMREIADWIVQHKLTQSDAARVFGVTRPRVSDIVNRKTAKFTVDTLLDLVVRTGKKVVVHVGR